jgi:transcriptional regulator with XRE-family HTH domain
MKDDKVIEGSGGNVSRRIRDRTPAYIQLVPDTQCAAGDALDFLGAEVRNNGAPFTDGCGTDVQRPRDIRGRLEVIENVALKHAPILSPLNSGTQVRSREKALTLVDMDKLSDLAERLADAMREAGVNAAQLADACGVTAAAVSKWLSRETRTLSADNYAAAARALGVNETWLRTGKLPRERDKQVAQLEHLQDALMELRDPLAAVLAAIDALAPSRKERKRTRGG